MKIFKPGIPALFVLILISVLYSCERFLVKKINPATITVYTDNKGHKVNPHLFGSNIQWEHDGDGILQTDHQIRKDIIPLLKSNVSILRFPGGSLSNKYKWRSGIGDVSKRPPGISFSGAEAPSNFGSDEFLTLCKLIECDGIITLNISEGEGAAAGWLEYMKSKNKGHSKFKYWEIGNELYSPTEPGHMEAGDYGKKVLSFSKKMKQIDPSAKIGACLEISFLQAAWMKNVYPHLLTWNEDVLKVCGRGIDFVSVHFYVPFDKAWDDRLHELVMAGPIIFEQNLNMIKDLLNTYCNQDVEIGVTEFGTFFDSKTSPSSRIASTENGLFSAMMLMKCINNPVVTLANHWSLLNNSSFGMLEVDQQNEIKIRPTYEVFKDMASFRDMPLLKTETICDTYNVEALGNIPTLSQVPYIETMAFDNEKENSVELVIVNRAMKNDIEITLNTIGSKSISEFEMNSLWSPAEPSEKWNKNDNLSIQKNANGNYNIKIPAYSISFLKGK